MNEFKFDSLVTTPSKEDGIIIYVKSLSEETLDEQVGIHMNSVDAQAVYSHLRSYFGE